MRKAMWKKGLSVAMAAAMLTGTVTVPAVFNTSAIVKAAEVAEKSMPATPKAIDGMVYATVNMEYADFFYGELNNIAAGNETTPDLSNDKVASYRETGMYDAVTSATNKKSIKYATSYYETGVANDEAETKGSNGTISNTTLYGIKEVKIAIPEALYHNLYEQKDDSANKNSKIYEYLNNADYSDEEFKSEYKVLNADGTFSKMITTEGTVEDKDAEPVLTTSTTWGDYQVDIANLGVGDTTATTTNMYGIILTDEKGENYGLLHSDNTWLQTQEFAWGTGFTTQSHGCPISGEHYASMMGKTIDAVTYYTENGVVKYDIDDTYVPYKFDTSAFKVENADVTSGSAKVTVPTLPEAYDAEYAVEGLTNVSVENGTLKYNATGVKPGQYTLNVTDKSSKYVPFSTSFTLTTDNVVAAYNNDVKAPALVAAKDVQADDFANFVKNIQKVSVNGKEYAASGKGAVKLINADGTLVTTADALKAEGTYNIVVTATGYNKTLEFTYTNKSDTTATKPSDATAATKPAATTTATKPAVKPVKKVTVKKQTAKVKAGKKKLTVTWKKDKNVSGYQIKIATKKNFKGAKTYTVKSYKTYKKVIKKLKAKKKYFVKVRAYKTVGKSKVYGAYSAVRSCKVK